MKPLHYPIQIELTLLQIVVLSTTMDMMDKIMGDADPAAKQMMKNIDKGVKKSLDKDARRLSKGVTRCMVKAYAIAKERGYLNDGPLGFNGHNDEMIELIDTILPEYLSKKDIDTIQISGSDLFSSNINFN